MRFQDWDILLYPLSCEVPFKEFKTTCYAVKDGNAGSTESGDGMSTPLLACFVPGVPEGKPFSISLHSWIKPAHGGALIMPGLRERALWQIKIVVDGSIAATKTYPHDCTWPQIILDSDSLNGDHLLRWPSFNKSTITQRHWDAAESAGRIKVELSAGFSERSGRNTVFTELSKIVCFSFFPAPIDHLEKCGIAWPNPKMFDKPLQAVPQLLPSSFGPTSVGMSHGLSNGMVDSTHRRTYSNGSTHGSSPMHGFPIPPPPTPALGQYKFRGLQPGDTHGAYDADFHSQTVPGLPHGQEVSNGFGSLSLPSISESPRHAKTRLEVRLPSDQLQKLIYAMSSPKEREIHFPNASLAMPPPPLPAHALAAKGTGNTQFVPQASNLIDPPLAPAANMSTAASRDESRGSDVSMHAGCSYFPICTTEDDAGLIVHSSPTCPSADVKSRKEGYSPPKPRDFLSTILGPQEQNVTSPVAATKGDSSSVSSSSPAETPARKRTRSALKKLSINDGSPEKKDGAVRKPVRKVSKSSSGGLTKEMVIATAGLHGKASVVDEEDKENQMVVDA